MIVIGAIFSILVVWFLKYVLDLQAFYSTLKDFKCPPQMFLFGHLAQLSSDIMGTVIDYNKKYGKLLHLNATYFAPILLITDHNVVKEIMTSTKAINKGRVYDAFHTLAKDSLPLATDKTWEGMRKLLSPAFTIQTLEKSIATFNSVASILAYKLGMNGDKEIHVTPLLDLCTLDASFESLVGSKTNSQLNENHNFNLFSNQMLDIFQKKLFSPWTLVRFIYVFTPTYWKEKSLVKAIYKETRSIITSRREEIQAGDEHEKCPFLDQILKGNIPGRDLTDDDIANEVNAFAFVSRDATGSTLASTLHMLSHYPDIQNRVVEELQTIFKDDKTRQVTSEDLKNMKYLEAVLKEIMRMYPAIPFMGRTLNEDQKFNGIFIPAGINIIISIHAMHNDADYFPNPSVFDPERFYGKNAASIKPFTFIPFGAGFRSCIGQRHAMCELKVIMTYILRRYELLPVGKKKLNMTFKLALTSKTPIKIRVKPRTCLK